MINTFFVNIDIFRAILFIFNTYVLALSFGAIVLFFINLLPQFISRFIKKPNCKSFIISMTLFTCTFFHTTRNIIIIMSFSLLVLFSINFILSVITILCKKMKHRNAKHIYGGDTYPKISVIFPVKNESKCICSSLDKVFNLDYPISNLNVIVVDDHSTDNTMEVITEYSKKHPLTIIKNDTKPGKASALNMVLTKISTEYVLILDADHHISKNFLKNGLSFFKDPDIALVQGKSRIRNGKNSFLAKITEGEYHILQNVFYPARKTSIFLGSGGIFRYSALMAAGPFNNSIPTEDWEMSYRLHQCGYKLIFCNDICTQELGPETIPDFFKQRYRWMRGTWIGVKTQFNNMLKSKNINLSQKIDFISFGAIPVTLTGYYIFNFFFLFGFFNIINPPVTANIYFLSLIPYLIFNATGLILAKKFWMLPFVVVLVPYQYLLYSFSAFDAMFDEWVLNRNYNGLKSDRSKINMD